MNINVYQDYEVKYTNKGSNLVGYNEFEREEFEQITTRHGWEFVKWISRLCEDENFDSIEIENNIIKISHFNPSSGEYNNYCFEFKEYTDKMLEERNG